MNTQLTLDLYLRDHASFSNFHIGANQQLVEQLHDVVAGASFYLWGAPGTGRTHLLQACCQAATQQGQTAVYLPMKALHSLSPILLENIESLALICMDDLDIIAGDPVWEEALFHLYNRSQAMSGRWIVAAASAPQHLRCVLPDLTSRLAASVIFQVQGLTDEDKLVALQMHAKVRGFDLPDEVGQFMLRRCSRDMSALCELLDQLDHASLATHRKLTIPFLKEVLFK